MKSLKFSSKKYHFQMHLHDFKNDFLKKISVGKIYTENNQLMVCVITQTFLDFGLAFI